MTVGIHVVFVDDDDLMLRIMEPALYELPTDPAVQTVRMALTPSGALDHVRNAPAGPLVVISDFNLKAPQTGIDVLHHAAILRPDSVRVLLSGYAADQIGDVSGGGNVHGFIEKPMRIGDIYAPLALIIRDRLAVNARARS